MRTETLGFHFERDISLTKTQSVLKKYGILDGLIIE